MSMFDKPPASGGLFGGKPGGKLFADAAEEFDNEDDFKEMGAEKAALAALNEAQLAFKARAAQEADRFELATDSEYWFAVCFQSRRQKEQFLAALKAKFKIDDDADKYLDGWMLAKAMGIHLDREDVPYTTSEGKQDRRWLSLTR